MAQCADHTLLDVHGAGRSFQDATRRSIDVSRFTNRGLNPELELLSHRDLDLRRLARRPEHAHSFDATLWADDRELFLAGELARLRKIGRLRQLMARAEERFDVSLREMN